MCHQQENTPLSHKFLIVRGLIACFLLMGILAPLAMHAQLNETGTITGTVTDLTGAVIPGAAVTITNVGTGVAIPVTTNGSGEFSQPGLNVGNYSVSVLMAGFGTFEQDNFYLAPTSVYAVKVILKPGDTTEKIEVPADAVHVETATNEISTEVSGKEANMLALGGRNYQQLSTLMPGVTNLSAASSMGTGGYLTQNAISVNGMGRTSVFYTLDGIWNQELGDLTTNTVTPDPESIDQVKLLQNNYSVQYNMMGGAVMMVHTTEGTSSFHGRAWYFYRNGALNALNYFVAPDGNPPFDWNIGGVGIGGPLVIPHFYNTNREKTFFYLNGQYVNQLTYATPSATEPTPAEIAGQFPVEIHDPVTKNDYPYNPATGTWTIPQSSIVPSAQAMLKAFVPPPNHVCTVIGCTTTNADVVDRSTGIYVNNKGVLFKQLDTMGKIDHIISPRLRLTGEYFREGVKQSLASASAMGSLYPTNWDVYYNNDSVAQIHLTQTISNTMLNQTSVSMDRYVVTHTFGGLSFTSQIPGFTENLAFPSAIVGLPGQWLPEITFSAGWTPLGTNSNYTQWRTAYLAETLTDNWTWLRGKHSFAAGGSFILGSSRINAGADNTAGTFNFNGNYTGTPIADFLTGYANTFEQGNTVVRKHLTYPIYSPYAEDQWKVLPRLTLTLGARYSYMPFANAQQGYATAFNPAAFNPANAATVSPSGVITPTPNWNPVNGLVYNGFNGVPYNLSSAHANYVSPSVGFAWDLYGNGQTSLRGGYSINYLKSGSSSDCEAHCVGLPVVSEIELSGASFPNPLNGLTSVPTAVSGYGEDMKNIQAAKIHSYSLSLEQQFGPSWIAEIAFAGVAGRNLPLELNINQPLPYQGSAYNPLLISSGPGNSFYSPYPGYDNILYATSTGIANWNALETSLRHPAGHNVTLRAAFTWAHGLSDVPGQAGYAQENSGVQDSYHPMNDYGSSPLNQDLNLSGSVIYLLPWFKTSGWTKSVFGGWDASAILSAQAGTSISPGVSVSDHGLATRPNINPYVPLGRVGGAHPEYSGATAGGPFGSFFNPCHFIVPNENITDPTITSYCSSSSPPVNTQDVFNGTFGNAPVGSIRGPAAFVDNVTLFKTFPIKGGYIARVRAEAFNLVNHPNFNGQDVNLGDPHFGYYTQAADPREIEFAVELLW